MQTLDIPPAATRSYVVSTTHTSTSAQPAGAAPVGEPLRAAEAGLWTEVVLMGRQGEEEITAHDVAQWKGTAPCDVLVGWRSRLPRVYLDE